MEGVIRYAKEHQINIIFVTDDVKPDWWFNDNQQYVFSEKLIEEFTKETRNRKTSNKEDITLNIVPFISKDFYEAISHSMGVPRTDAVDQALKITDNNYIDNIQFNVFDTILGDLVYSGFDYVEEIILTNTGSEGIDNWEIDNYEFDNFTMIERTDDSIVYKLVYNVEMSTSSYDYWGRDHDTKEVITSPAYEHTVSGSITVKVVRDVNLLMDFLNSNEFESAEIIYGDFIEVNYKSCFDENDDYIPDDITCVQVVVIK